jgi:hypothetical protein
VNQPTVIPTNPDNKNSAVTTANPESGIAKGEPQNEKEKEPKIPEAPEREEVVAPKPKYVRSTGDNAKPTNAADRQSQPVANSNLANKLVRDAEQKYLAAITILKRDYDKRRTQLNPQFVAKMDAALSTIDSTIAETRKAVRQNPDDPIALQYMLAAYAKKVEVLKGVAGS